MAQLLKPLKACQTFLLGLGRNFIKPFEHGHDALIFPEIEDLDSRQYAPSIFSLLVTVVKVPCWRALGKASKPSRFPTTVWVGDDGWLVAELCGRSKDDGLLEVVLTCADGAPVHDAIAQRGHVPLPPYIRREDDSADAENYQTVYARVEGAVAAPTAGLHLTNRILGAMNARGVRVVTITLHVGPGTFQPVCFSSNNQAD